MEKIHFRHITQVEKENWWYHGKREILLSIISRLDLPKGVPVLDIGCGTGLLLKLLDQNLDLDCYGLEPEAGFFRIASSLLPNRIANTTLDRPLPASFPKKYGLVICIDTLEHIKGDRKAAIRMTSLLKRNGSLLLYCPSFMFLWSSLDEISHHFRRYTKEDLVTLGNHSRLKMVFASYSNFILFFPLAFVRFISRLAGRDILFDPTGLKPLPRPINSLFFRVFSFEKYLFPNLSLPLGSSVIAIFKKIHDP